MKHANRLLSAFCLGLVVVMPSAYADQPTSQHNYLLQQGTNYGYQVDGNQIIWVEYTGTVVHKDTHTTSVQVAIVPSGSTAGPEYTIDQGDISMLHPLNIRKAPSSFTVQERNMYCGYSDPFSCQLALNWTTNLNTTAVVFKGSLMESIYDDAIHGKLAITKYK